MVNLTNSHLKDMKVDIFHHLGFSTETVDVSQFKDVKIVCVCGSSGRVQKLSEYLRQQLNLPDVSLVDLCATDRYTIYKLGPLLISSHGMGVPSAGIILHELFKLLHYAGAEDVVFLRLGTCGGVGVDPGTVVATRRALNEYLQPTLKQVVLGKEVEYGTVMDEGMTDEFLNISLHMQDKLHFNVVAGDTMCCADFYEGQARLEGAFCSYTREEKDAYIHHLQSAGVANIEMESLLIAAMCNRAHLRSACLCVVLVDRVHGDQIELSGEQIAEFQMRPWALLLEFVHRKFPQLRKEE